LGALESWSLTQKTMRKRLAMALGAKQMLAGAAAIHYTTERERRESEGQIGLSNGIVIPLGVELAEPHPPTHSSRGEGAYVLFLSRLHPKKGVELLLDAFARVLTPALGHPSWSLVIAGSGEASYERDLHQRAASLGIEDRVRFAGWVERDEKRQVLAGAGLFVLPSAQENFGIAALEAMAAGVPVAVSRDVDLSDEIVAADAGWVFTRTVDGIGEALRTALTNPEERHRRGGNGRELARRRFQWPVIANSLVNLYEQIAKSRNPQIATVS
jgi:glycosyltransferase involved in cell wall biosynthesis